MQVWYISGRISDHYSSLNNKFLLPFQFLTDADVQINKNKSTPGLFQLLFDYKLLTTVPKVHFLPWTIPTVSKHVNVVSSRVSSWKLEVANIYQRPVQGIRCAKWVLRTGGLMISPVENCTSRAIFPSQ